MDKDQKALGPMLNLDLPRVRLQWILLWDKQSALRIVNENDL